MKPEGQESQAARLGPFDLLEPLAKGAMGEVWRGRHRDQDVPVAIKFLLEDDDSDDWATDAFATEVRAAAGLSHPNIVMVLDHGLLDASQAAALTGRMRVGTPYLVMEYIEGDSLHAWAGRLHWATLQDVLVQLLDALGHSHARGVIHRDLKPGNVLLEWPGQPGEGRPLARLTDFGLAQAISQVGEGAGVIAGTPAYMAPEQLQGDWRDQGDWTDLYSVGCLAWALVCGQPPFGRKRLFHEFCEDHLRTPPPALDPLVPVPAELEGWLRRLLQKKPEHRYQRASAASAALERLGEPVALVLRQRQPIGGQPLDLSTRVDLVDALESELFSGRSPEQPPVTPLMPVAGGDQTTQVLPEDAPLPARDVPEPELQSNHAPPLPLTRAQTPDKWRVSARPPMERRLRGVGLALFGIRSVPIVDRHSERDALWSALLRSERLGISHVVVLDGPPGTGRTRLATWLAERAHADASAVVLRATHTATSTAGSGLAEMLGRFLRCGGVAPDRLRERIARSLRRRGIDAVDDVGAIAELVAPGRSSGERVQLADARERHVLIERVLDAACHRSDMTRPSRPALVLLDDVHWGEESVDFVNHVLHSQTEHPLPVLVVMSVQTSALSELPDIAAKIDDLFGHPRVERLTLGPLPAEAHQELIRTHLGLERSLALELAERTSGNPLFAVQLVGGWISQGLLCPGPEGFVLAEGIEGLPEEDVDSAWPNRILRMLEGRPPSEGRALELAAVLGGEIDRTEWRATCALSGARPSDPLLHQLLDQHLIVACPRNRWAFAHPMLRDVLLDRADEHGRLERHHRDCARMLAARIGGDASTEERAARHLVAAREDEAAVPLLLNAAARHASVGELTGARQLLDLAQTAMDEIPVSPADHSRALLAVARLEVLRRGGQVKEALALAVRLVADATEHRWNRELPLALVERAGMENHFGDADAARASLASAVERARAIGDHRSLARCRVEQGRLHLERGEWADARVALESARAESQAGGDRTTEANSHWMLGRICRQNNDLDGARDGLQRALDLFRSEGSRWGEVKCINELGELARMLGDLDGARDHYQDAMERMDRLGAPDLHIVRLNLALVLLLQRRSREARPLLERSLRAFIESEHRALVGCSHVLLLPCCAAIGDWAGWDRHLVAAQAELHTSGFVDVDIAEAAQSGAREAETAGQISRARQAWRLAAAQWARLERGDDAEACLEHLQALDVLDD